MWKLDIELYIMVPEYIYQGEPNIILVLKTIRMDKDIEDAISRKTRFHQTEKDIGDATLQGLSIQAIRDQTKKTKLLTQENTSLQNKIYWLTVAIVVLTVILVILGFFQLTKL